MTTVNTNHECAKQISFDIENGHLKSVVFHGGCPGNLKAIGTLLEGMPVEQVIEKLKGITCGQRSTSCTDQLACALENLKTANA